MNGRIKIAMVLGTLIILIIGVSCVTGENFTHNDAQHYKHNSISVDKINNSSFEKVSVEKTVPADSQSIKKAGVEQSSKTVTKSNAVATQGSNKNVKSKDGSVKKVAERSDVKKDSIREEDKVVNGWNPKDHEVSREDLGDGMQRVTFDDGYFRIVDYDGKVVTYGY